LNLKQPLCNLLLAMVSLSMLTVHQRYMFQNDYKKKEKPLSKTGYQEPDPCQERNIMSTTGSVLAYVTETVARISDAGEGWYFVTARRKNRGEISVRYYWADVRPY